MAARLKGEKLGDDTLHIKLTPDVHKEFCELAFVLGKDATALAREQLTMLVRGHPMCSVLKQLREEKR